MKTQFLITLLITSCFFFSSAQEQRDSQKQFEENLIATIQKKDKAALVKMHATNGRSEKKLKEMVATFFDNGSSAGITWSEITFGGSNVRKNDNGNQNLEILIVSGEDAFQIKALDCIIKDGNWLINDKLIFFGRIPTKIPK